MADSTYDQQRPQPAPQIAPSAHEEQLEQQADGRLADIGLLRQVAGRRATA